MDYKFILCCTQEAVAGANAQLSVTIGGTKVVSSTEITSTDASSPTLVVFEATGLSNPGDSTDVTMLFEIDNDVYVDGSDDRNIMIQEMYYTDKADGTNYKKWNNTTGVYDAVDFTSTDDLERSLYTALSGDDQPAYVNGLHEIIIFREDVTVTYPLSTTSGSLAEWGYPVSEHRA